MFDCRLAAVNVVTHPFEVAVYNLSANFDT
jgi:hypothetical protein